MMVFLGIVIGFIVIAMYPPDLQNGVCQSDRAGVSSVPLTEFGPSTQHEGSKPFWRNHSALRQMCDGHGSWPHIRGE